MHANVKAGEEWSELCYISVGPILGAFVYLNTEAALIFHFEDGVCLLLVVGESISFRILGI